MMRFQRARVVAGAVLVGAAMVLASCAETPAVLEEFVDGPAADVEVDDADVPTGDRFVDDDRHYALTIDPEWERLPDMMVDGIEFWLVEASLAFGSNVNVLTEPLPGRLGLEVYLDAGIENAPRFIDDFVLVDRQVVDAPAGKLGMMEYTGNTDGRPLQFLQVVMIDDDRAIVATLTTPIEDFDRLRVDVEPFLLTLGPA